jgi:hypothetical protein
MYKHRNWFSPTSGIAYSSKFPNPTGPEIGNPLLYKKKKIPQSRVSSCWYLSQFSTQYLPSLKQSYWIICGKFSAPVRCHLSTLLVVLTVTRGKHSKEKMFLQFVSWHRKLNFTHSISLLHWLLTRVGWYCSEGGNADHKAPQVSENLTQG